MKKTLQALFIISGVFSALLSAEDGILDGTFGIGDGKVTTGVGTSQDQFYAVTVQPDGKIVSSGVTFSGVTFNFVVVRYQANGSLDNTFGSGGKVETVVGTLDAYANAIALQSDGKIVVGGYTNDGGTVDSFAVVRYNSDGTLDSTFGSGGKVVTGIGSTDDKAQSMVLQTDGKIVMAGYSNNGSNTDVAVVRYNSDGTLDNTFDGDGKVTTAIGSSDEQANSVTLQPDGKIVVAGYTYNGSTNDFAVVRYNSDGTLDNTFDMDGKAILSIAGIGIKGKSVAMQSDGKIVVAGFNGSGIIVARFTGSSSASLPVELTSFFVGMKGSGVELTWSTATEVNNYGFEVERKQIPLNPPLQGGKVERIFLKILNYTFALFKCGDS